MNQRNKYLLLAALLALLLASASFGYRRLTGGEGAIPPPAPEAAAQDSAAAPDFTVQDAEGSLVSLSDFRGRPVIVNFWATWCGPCQSELPAFDRAYAAYGEQVSFMMVDLTDGVEETVEGVSAFVAENGYTFPVYFDVEGNTVQPYSLNAIPVTVAIDQNGAIVWKQVGSLDAETLEQVISLLLDEDK